MAIKNQNFTIHQRSDYILELTITDEDDTPIALASASFEWTMFNRVGAVILNFTSDDPGRFVIADGVGILQIYLFEEDLDIPGAVYQHECRLRDVFGNTAPTTFGTVVVKTSKTNMSGLGGGL